MENRVDIKLETDVVTGETVAHFVTSILESLLYQRNQIPFVCKTFKYLVSKWDKNEENDHEPGNFQVERQKNLAKQTMDDIRAMANVIRKAFDESNISSVRFLFGSVAVTPKEAYTIQVPSVTKSHSYEHHKLKTTTLNQALISLLTSNSLYNTFSTNLSPTNVFLQLEMPDSDAKDWQQMLCTDLIDLPASCKHVVINLVHTLPGDFVETECCRELKIFQDISTLSLGNDQKCCEAAKDETNAVGWWEVSTIVKGFKEKSVKGKNLWQ